MRYNEFDGRSEMHWGHPLPPLPHNKSKGSSGGHMIHKHSDIKRRFFRSAMQDGVDGSAAVPRVAACRAFAAAGDRRRVQWSFGMRGDGPT